VEGHFLHQMSTLDRMQLGRVLNGSAVTAELDPFLPVFWKITRSGAVDVLDPAFLGGLKLHLSSCSELQWFEISREAQHDVEDCNLAHRVANADARHGPSFFIISSTSVFAGSAETWGIATVYLTLVLAVGRLVRSGLGGLGFRIQLEDMGARVELITQLVEYIYQARMHISINGDHNNSEEAKPDLELEESLYEALINMLRIPEFLMRETGFYKHSFPPKEKASHVPGMTHLSAITQPDSPKGSQEGDLKQTGHGNVRHRTGENSEFTGNSTAPESTLHSDNVHSMRVGHAMRQPSSLVATTSAPLIQETVRGSTTSSETTAYGGNPKPLSKRAHSSAKMRR